MGLRRFSDGRVSYHRDGYCAWESATRLARELGGLSPKEADNLADRAMHDRPGRPLSHGRVEMTYHPQNGMYTVKIREK